MTEYCYLTALIDGKYKLYKGTSSLESYVGTFNELGSALEYLAENNWEVVCSFDNKLVLMRQKPDHHIDEYLGVELGYNKYWK